MYHGWKRHFPAIDVTLSIIALIWLPNKVQLNTISELDVFNLPIEGEGPFFILQHSTPRNIYIVAVG